MFSFKSFEESDFNHISFGDRFNEDIDIPIDITTIKSGLVRFLILMKDTVAFH